MINKVGSSNNISGGLNQQRINATLDFQKVLEQAQGKDLKISAHAQNRLKERNIELSQNDIVKLKEAVDSVRSKGGREALILYNNIAFITSVRNNTIVTAVDSESLKENVFTNIDSAILI